MDDSIKIMLFALAITVPTIVSACASCLQRRKRVRKRRATRNQRATAETLKPVSASPKRLTKQTHKLPSEETVTALHLQADAELHIAEAIEKRRDKETDPVKRARLEKQAALAWVRFHSILDKIEHIISQE